MHRPRFVVAIATAAMLLTVAACGGSSASPGASATGAPTDEPVATSSAPASAAPSAGAVESPSSAAGAPTTAAAKCGGVAVRRDPMSNGKVIVRVKAGGKVRVVATVTGDAYQGGSCGTSGSDWLKVDRVNGKSIKALYGVPFGYVAAGFFQ